MADSRREFIKKAGLLTAAAGLSNMLPAAIQKALAINAPEGSTYLDAEHIVFLMQENRSFDHCFGSLKGVRGFNDPRAITLPNGNPVWLQRNAAGQTYAPFRLNIKDTKSTWMSSLPHSWSNQVNARNDGKYDQWLNVKRSGNKAYADMPLTLGYHTREDIPFYYAFADAFTVCDQHFCSSLTGTNPNRLYFWSGTIREAQIEKAIAHVWNEDVDYGSISWPTFPERLEDHGISWKCYQNELSLDVGFHGEEDPWLANFQDNDLEFFAQYHAKLHPPFIKNLPKKAAAIEAEIQTLAEKLQLDPSSGKIKKDLANRQHQLQDVKADMEKYQAGMFEKLSQREQNLHKKAFVTNVNDPDYHQLTEVKYNDNGTERTMQVPKGDILHQFREDVKTGKLPVVSWLTAPENFSDHPSAAWYGAWYVSEVLDILTQNPEVWKKTIFVLTYDENDGYFDHIPPFVAPHSHKKGTGKVSEGIDTHSEFVTLEQELDRKEFPQKYDRESPIGLGYRVPMVIASPWSKGGWVNSEVFDHTSSLQFLEHFLSHKTGRKITETNITDWRRTVCGNLTSAFRPYHGETINTPAPISKTPFMEGIYSAKFKNLPDGYHAFSAADIEQAKISPQSSPYLPKQEPGIKPSCPLRYELYAEGALIPNGFQIKLKAGDAMFGKNALGAPFHVYAPGRYKNDNQELESLRAWEYAVKAGDEITDTWPLDHFENSNYHLCVYGPNGFFREFKGSAADPKVFANLDYGTAGHAKALPTGHLIFNLNAAFNGQVEIIDNAYLSGTSIHTLTSGNKAQQIVKNLAKSHHWYDFSIKVKGHPGFERRFAGRVETGNPGFSDPFMGRVV